MEGLEDLDDDLIEDRDLEAGTNETKETTSNVKVETTKEPSARERAMLRRKSRSVPIRTDNQLPKKNLAKFDLEESELFLQVASEDALLRILLALRSNILNATWTVRHGALLGVKTLIRERKSKLSMMLLAILTRDILAVLGLDRFSDFVGDQTIAPVRETAAQALAMIFSSFNQLPAVKKRIWDLILMMADHGEDWQVRHSGLLCIKYLAAIDPTSLGDETKLVELGLAGCEDLDEDIRSLSAELLGRLCNSNDSEKIDKEAIYEAAMTIIRDVDDDSSVASATIVHALNLLLTLKDVLKPKFVLVILAMRMRHPMSAVREGVLKVMEIVIAEAEMSLTESIVILRTLIQNIILDDLDEIKSRSFMLAEKLTHKLSSSRELLAGYVSLCSILLTPTGKPFEERHFVFVSSYDQDSGAFQTTSKPAAHEIGFRASDVMLQRTSSIGSRRLASRIVAKVSACYDASVQQKIATSLLNGDDPMSQCVGWWIFGENCAGRIPEDPLELWDLRKWCAGVLAYPTKPININALCQLMGMEDEIPLQEDVGLLVKLDCSDKLLDAVKSRETRQNALSIFRYAACVPTLSETVDFETILSRELVIANSHDGHDGHLPLNWQELLERGITEEDETIWNSNLVVNLFIALMRKELVKMMDFMIEFILPMMKSKNSSMIRIRILTIIQSLFVELPERLSEYASMFLVPVLGRIADSTEQVRLLSSSLFGELVRLVPLCTKMTSLSLHSTAVLQASQEADSFLSQFMGDSPEDLKEGGHGRALCIPECDFPDGVEIRAELRPYQKAGINWLAFLHRFGLNGALCDDMGLGKTLQTICMLAIDQGERDCAKGALPRLSSLVVCPASLVGHWRHEVLQFAPSLGEPLLIAGSPAERRNLWKQQLDSRKIIVTSYEVLRSDLAAFTSQHWAYVVLDEGHVIKNPKTKLTMAVKCLHAEHRLILSGTPIQNNVVELWSLFDFLMPGMLGDESQFMDRYGRAIMAVQPSTSMSNNTSRSTAGAKEFADAEAKLKNLHKQVLPFLLRRMKEQVLKELPPKIIQDYECDPSSIQRILYEDLFSDAEMTKEVVDSLEQPEKKAGMHVFQALQYLRKICVHPAMVLTDDHPLREQVATELKTNGWSLDDLVVAPKLLLLKELLEECGLGPEGEEELEGEMPHRVLIFAQQKSTLDLIERLVFARHLPQLRFLRIDGTVEQRARFDIAQRFNSDSSIGALLLTTSVGGLGLNLTGADTVIFMEHDWNPMKDLQAMDRAHRIGQKRVVSVYRLVLRGTLEQQILGMQRWKTKVAATVVQQQGEERVDLLELLAPPPEKRSRKEESGGIGKWMAKHGAILAADDGIDATEGTPQINEYEKAFNVDNFIESLEKTSQ